MYVQCLHNLSRRSSLLLVGIALTLGAPAARAQQNPFPQIDQSFVLVRITTVMPAPDGPFKQLKILSEFPSTGIVMDDKNHILTYLGGWWMMIRSGKPTVEVVDAQGQRRAARIVGIDQSTTIAVLEYEGKPLKRTPLCENCEHKDIATVILPPQEENPTVFRLETAPIVLVGTGLASTAGAWTVQISRPLSLIGGPLLDSKQRVIGIVSDQDVQAVPKNLRVTIYPLTTVQVLTSANKIIKENGDIVTGWLGVHIDISFKSGVLVTGFDPGSPAHKAGIQPGDVMVKWNGVAISDYRKYIEIVENTAVGTKATIEVIRDGKPVQINAIIEARRRPRP